MRYGKFLIPGITLITVLESGPLMAGPLESIGHPYQESARTVHEAEHNVDHAWEVYHRAALGGTVASPSLQAEIEEHLHVARTLITQAQEAAEQGDSGRVEHLVRQIRLHAAQAIEGSKEPKK